VPLIAAIKAEDLDIPVMVVITDLITVHQVWFNDEVTLITVPTEAVREMALESGFSPSQIALTGIPVDPVIDALKDADVNDMRKSLAWKVDLISLLVMGR
jgi:UDP-N-acetylglucosamine:LPS N-acetylglucosamine transferase